MEAVESAVLDEDIGSLETINPVLQKAFQGYSHGGGRPERIARRDIGPKSEITITEPIKNATQALKELTGGAAAGLILELNGEQVFAVFGKKSGHGRREGGFDYVIDEKWVKANAGDSKFAEELSYYRIADGRNDVKEGDILTIIRRFIKIAKDSGFKVTGKMVQVDEERSAKRAERRANPAPTKISRQDAARALNSRLEAYKKDNAKSIKTPEELLAFINAEGYADKIKIGDYIYEYYQDSLRMSTLKGKDSFNKTSTIEYKLDRHSDAYKKIEKELWAIDDEDEREKIREESFPPGLLSIHMALKGGSIVPTKVEADNKGYW